MTGPYAREGFQGKKNSRNFLGENHILPLSSPPPHQGLKYKYTFEQKNNVPIGLLKKICTLSPPPIDLILYSVYGPVNCWCNIPKISVEHQHWLGESLLHLCFALLLNLFQLLKSSSYSLGWILTTKYRYLIFTDRNFSLYLIEPGTKTKSSVWCRSNFICMYMLLTLIGNNWFDFLSRYLLMQL